MHHQAYEFFMLRRAAMPEQTLSALNEQSGADFQKWESALLDLFQNSPFGRAVYLASPTLFAALQAYDKRAPEKARQKILFSAYKYLIRMCSRATPFGMFSVTSTGVFSRTTKLTGSAISPVGTALMLKMSVLECIASWLEKHQATADHTRYLPSSSLYQARETLRFIDSQPNDDITGPVLSEIDRSAELDMLLVSAQHPATRGELAEALAQLLSKDEAAALVKAAVEAGVLVSGLSANITGDDFQNRVLKTLEAAATICPEAGKLHALICGLSKDPSLSRLKETTTALAGYFPELSGKTLFRAQLIAPGGKAKLGKAAISRIASDFNAVTGLLQQRNIDPTPLDELKGKFGLRYGSRQVPLCELMESDIGLRYAGLAANAAGILDKLDFNWQAPPASAAITVTGQVKQRIFEQALARQLYCVQVLESDLKELKVQPLRSSGHFLLGEMLATSGKNIDRGYFQFYLKAAGGESGLELMARFAQHDPALTAQLQKATRQIWGHDEQHLHAEIAHIPDAEIASVLARPHLWPYEIPYQSQSTLPGSSQIPIVDVLVSVAADGEMILTSKRLCKRIIPHNTTAHNYGRGLPVYQLLSDLAHQNSPVISWSWEHLETFTFLPRVVYGNLILCAARWKLAGETRKKMLDALKSDSLWQRLRTEMRIPRFIQICQGDNLLLIDCQNHFARALFGKELEKSEQLQIQECLQTSQFHPVKGKEGKFCHELLLAFKPAAPITRERTQLKQTGPRHFHLGSRWLYVKIYTDPNQVDRLLTRTLTTLCQQLSLDGKIHKWFFVRYSDPSHHLRLRLEIALARNWQPVLSRLQSALEAQLADGLIEKIQVDSYEREIERYSCLDYEQTESIFHQDSLASAQVISLLKNDISGHARWQAALYSMDLMLADFGLDVKSKAEFAQHSYQAFLSEFGQDQTLTRQLDQKYRIHCPEITQTLTGQSMFSVMLAGCFKERSALIRQLATPVSTTEISSYLHMAVNRILEEDHRRQEMVLYHFLKKYYHMVAKRCTNTVNN